MSLNVLALCLLAVQLASGCTKWTPGHRNLDLVRYQGTWNLIGFVEPEAFTGQKHRCVSELYYKRDDNLYLVDTVWNGTINGERVSQPGLITLATHYASDASQWEMYMDAARFEATVIATDYTTWAVERTCGNIPVPGEPDTYFERLMIRSRFTYLSASVLSTLMTLAESYGYNANNFEFIEHSNC